jgi:2-C-methyl-D-erythritol 4-phosphate cytidylyltransferase
MKDTPKQVGADRLIQRTLDRTELWLAQTPQTFRRALIVEAYRKAEIAHVHGTDDAALVERLGHKVAIVEGSWENIKVTTPEDLVLAEAILAARSKDVNR